MPIVIYASADDRCAHIVLSIRPGRLQGHRAAGVQSLRSAPESETVAARRLRFGRIIKRSLLRAATDTHFKVYTGASERGERGGREIRLGSNHLLKAVSEPERSEPHFISQDGLSSLIKTNVMYVSRGKTWRRLFDKVVSCAAIF